MPNIEVSNGAGRDGMASRLSGYLSELGLPARRLTNADDFKREATTIYYSEGWEVYAMGLASILPVQASLIEFEGGRSDIRIEIGKDLFQFDRELLAKRQPVEDLTG